MKLSRIVKVVEPEKDNKWRGGLYNIYFEHLPDQKVVMIESRYILAKFEDEMLARGVSSDDIEKHRELAIEYRMDEESLEGESY